MKFIFALLFLYGVCGQTFNENGYQDLVVAIHPDVSPDHQQTIIDNLKEWIGKGSQQLYNATQKYAYIKSVNILLPKTWTDVPADPVSGLSYEDGVIRVDKPNPLYEDGPYTLQPGGCRDRGEFIHVTPNFVVNLNTSSTQSFGPPEKVFVHEFAKLRYGVFEEFGYPGDSQYPMFYYEQNYVDGTLVSTLTPNFCTDAPLQGIRQDIADGGSCKFDPQTNLPNENCTFVPVGDNSGIRSSYMSLPSLENLDKFCNDTETLYPHNPFRPNKHNAMCDQKSTWSVIIGNEDFVGVTPMDSESAPETTFKILRPEDERFVFVLDVSGSMAGFDRIERLIQSSNRWVKYEVREGSQVGVTSFSSNVNTVQKLTVISSDTVRDEITRKIDSLKAKGGTCLGAGLKNGMNVLNGVGDSTSGGVILFVTDGVQDCDGPDKDTITDPALLQRVKDTKVRIITIAFGSKTDTNLENLAVVSGGKTYFVPDGTGIEDINDAFEGSLTFQPAVPSGEVDIVVFSEVYKEVNGNLTEAFVIDKTLGRNAKFQMDYIVDASSDIEKIRFIFANESVFEFSNSEKSPFIAKFDFLEEGEYTFTVSPKAGKIIKYLNVVVSAKAAEDDTLPFHTRCWLSAGNSEVDMSTKKLSILAQVSQGNRPVLNAKVQALIEDGSQPLPLTLDLFDNGAGADVIANDGVYSRYFVKYDGKNGDYTLRCQVKGDENTNFVAQRAETFYNRIRRMIFPRAFPIQVSPTSPFCCGSNADSSQIKKEPTGLFERKMTGTSFKLKNVPSTDIFPPSKVTDLRAEQFQSVVEITFTAPGDNYDEGNATRYDIRFSVNNTDFYDETLWDELNSITGNDVISGTLEPVEAGSVVIFTVSKDIFPSSNDIYFLSMKSYDEQNLTSPISSPIQLKTYPYDPEDGLSGGAIAGIVIGVLLAVLIVVVTAYLIVKRRK